jgi:hypothetical protein
MIDPEVARLRRLRSEALLVREIARTFESSQWAANESLLDRSACASWRIARVISGRLRGHPYAEYQKDAGAAARATNRLHASCLALINKGRLSALKVLEAHVARLSRHLEDCISLTWSSDFSAALVRSHFEIKAVAAALALETRNVVVTDRPALRPSRPEGVVGELGAALEGDWPYLAF